ncbi:MAG: SGNH/GDSL hydrolase family protein [Nocardiaceae bacterium]|nr:SGNH/GDSL hydrolase family protein [Nocardiaceae bacterium]
MVLDRNAKLAVAILLTAALLVPVGLWWDNHRIHSAPNSYRPTATSEKRQDLSNVVFIGDYYTAVADESSFWKSVSSKLCWNATALGVGGTGYTTVPSTNFISRVDAVVAAKPDIVIIEGSTNDRDLSRIEDAARQLYGQLRHQLPTATLIAVGPVIPLQERAAPLTDRVTALKAAATANGVLFIDASEFLPADMTYFQKDEVLPSGAGLRLYGEKLVSALPASINRCN